MKNEGIEEVIEKIGGLLTELQDLANVDVNYDDLMNIGKENYNQGYGSIIMEISEKYYLIRKVK